MNSKFYVSLEAARLLKEKGYNEECDCAIDEDSEIHTCEYRMNQDLPEWKWSCPTKAEAIDWLESKGIVVAVNYNRLNATRGKNEWSFCIYDKPYMLLKSEVGITSRLEAEEAAIIKALELL